MNYIWIEKQGIMEPTSLLEILKGYCKYENTYLAYYCDHFDAGLVEEDSMNSIDVDSLLEIRIFNKNMEFLARRSNLRDSFHWRIASDDARTANFNSEKKSEKGYLLPDTEDMTYMVQEQLLDINSDKSSGNNFVTLGGGKYTLPITEKDTAVRIMVYLTYDKRGMTSAADFRVCGFVSES